MEAKMSRIQDFNLLTFPRMPRITLGRGSWLPSGIVCTPTSASSIVVPRAFSLSTVQSTIVVISARVWAHAETDLMATASFRAVIYSALWASTCLYGVNKNNFKIWKHLIRAIDIMTRQICHRLDCTISQTSNSYLTLLNTDLFFLLPNMPLNQIRERLCVVH